VATLAAVACPLAACGAESAPERSPRAVVEAFLAARSAADGERMCALYSDDYRTLGARDPDNEEGLSCEELAEAYARRYGDEDNRVLRVEESGDVAVATLSCEDSTASDCSLPMVKQEDQWKIDGSLSPND
jgi:ketosteroid isomerase-like protein